MDFTVDDSRARALAAELDSVVRRIPVEAEKSTKKAAVKVKRTMRNDMAKTKWFHQVTPTINFDMVGNPHQFIEAQIGPQSEGKQVGDLALFAYFGGANGGGGKVRDPMLAAKEEAAAYEEALGDILKGLG